MGISKILVVFFITFVMFGSYSHGGLFDFDDNMSSTTSTRPTAINTPCGKKFIQGAL